MEIIKNGGPVMYPLLICSFITLTVVIERIVFWITVWKGYDQKLIDDVMELCRKADWQAVRKRAGRSGNYMIRILVSGILHREYSMVKAMEAAAADEIRRMRRFMNVLDTMITIAPLLGIFGTVIGIISSFDMLGAGIEHPELVTGGIAQALITTAFGLAIAIFTVFPYNYFNSKVEQAAQAIEKYATSLEIVYEKMSAGNPQLSKERSV